MNAAGQRGKPPSAPKKRRWIWPLLIISNGFNLLFVGMVAGRIWTHGYDGHDEGRYRIFTGAVEELMKNLPDDKRLRARDLLMRHRETVRQLRKRKQEERLAAEKAVLSEPYDEAKVAEVLAHFREISGKQHKSMHNMMIGLLKNLTLKERQELLNNIKAGLRHRGKHRHHQDERPLDEPERQQPR